jgi:hypothetical protein
MIKQKGADDAVIPIDLLVQYNKDIYYNQEIPADTYTPIAKPQNQHIT